MICHNAGEWGLVSCTWRLGFWGFAQPWAQATPSWISISRWGTYGVDNQRRQQSHHTMPGTWLNCSQSAYPSMHSAISVLLAPTSSRQESAVEACRWRVAGQRPQPVVFTESLDRGCIILASLIKHAARGEILCELATWHFVHIAIANKTAGLSMYYSTQCVVICKNWAVAAASLACLQRLLQLSVLCCCISKVHVLWCCVWLKLHWASCTTSCSEQCLCGGLGGLSLVCIMLMMSLITLDIFFCQSSLWYNSMQVYYSRGCKMLLDVLHTLPVACHNDKQGWSTRCPLAWFCNYCYKTLAGWLDVATLHACSAS